MRSWLQQAKRGRTWTWAVVTALELALNALVVSIALGLLLLAAHFPYGKDAPLLPEEVAKIRTYYATAYAEHKSDAAPESQPEKEDAYVTTARGEIRIFRVKETVESFVERFNLQGRKVLDVGSGTGYLQDVANDYTGLDISPSARRFYHKPFVVGSATAMPFADNSFDAVWSIWVLEHVTNPEQALREMRRVAKDGGLLFLAPAWDVRYWAAQGYEFRPYHDFGPAGKLLKASIPAQRYFACLSEWVVRPARAAAWKLTGRPTIFRYSRLEPNYKQYYGPDADAVNSLDRAEMALWFTSRGDECLNCPSLWHGQDAPQEPTLSEIVIRVRKREPDRVAGTPRRVADSTSGALDHNGHAALLSRLGPATLRHSQ
ncbi:MAG TPA: class I SAM-dependent methyltransferase [Bryobacterales bacterium]|nr:class I SAM-dependent methyltransferase [Bryobacterales bacterium]